MKSIKKVRLTCLFPVFFFFSVNAQTTTFQKMYGTTQLAEYLFDLTEYSSGGYISAGVQYKTQLNGDIYLLRTDVNGSQLWAKSFGDTLFQQALAVREGEGGDIFVAGSSNQHVFVLKTDSMGTEKWIKKYSGTGFDQCNVMEKIPGGFVIGGTRNAGSTYLFKIDSAGTVLWSQTYNSFSNTEIVETVKACPDGSLVFGGYSIVTMPSAINAFLAKTDSLGNIQWWHYYKNGSGQVHDLDILDDGAVIMGGEGANNQMLLLKADTAGNLQWAKAFGLGVVDLFFSVKILADGNVLLAGHSFISGGSNLGYDMALIKCDTAGNFTWIRNIGDYYNDQCYAVTVCNDGGYALCGMTDNNSSLGGFPGIGRLVKTDSLGISGCSETIRSYTSANIALNDTLVVKTFSPGFSSTPVSMLSGFSGTDSTLCTTTGIQNEIFITEKISYYPNPVEEILNVTCSMPGENSVLEIYDAFGKKVFASSSSFQLTNSFNLSFLSTGIYFLKIRNGKDNVTGKIIKL
jgi:hypothetical protein